MCGKVNLHYTEEGYTLIGITIPRLEQQINFLIDTGSSHSFVFARYFDIIATKGYNINSNSIDLPIFIDGALINHRFVKYENHLTLKQEKVIGIIGVDFLLKNRCIIDYQSNTFVILSHKQKHSRNKIFSYPIHIGYEKIGIPIVGIMSDSSSSGCIIDTGSEINLMSGRGLNEYAIKPKLVEKASIVLKTYDKNIVGKPYQIKFNIASLSPKGISPVRCEDLFFVTDERSNIFDKVDVKLPIKAILGNHFLRQNKWILDFCNDIMFFHQ